MKVLTLKEPWGTLIKEKQKLIETRSWKTNYRGELYIHTGLEKVDEAKLRNKEIINYIKDKDYKYGYIICKCNLKDCIHMTEEYIEDMKKNEKEYLCGDYQIGRYAWVLENIEVLDKPILAKGKLRIWDYNEN